MNERDYFIFSQISLFMGIITLIVGSFLLEIFEQLYYANLLLIFFIFILFFGLSIYFNAKKDEIHNEVMDEIKKYIKDDDNESSEVQELQ